jgi:hypothetical protein
MTPRDPECWVFLSHIHEDEPVALWLKERLERDFVGKLGVFVSSEAPAGEDWFPNLQEHLEKSAFLFALCSPLSVIRPWVHFEVGAAWALKNVVIPVCHGGQEPADLGEPFSRRLGVTLTDPRGIRRLYESLLPAANLQEGDWDYDAYAKQVPQPEPVGGAPDNAAATDADPDGAIRRRLHESMTRKHKWRTIPWLATGAGLDDEQIVLTILRADDDVRFTRSTTGKLMAGLKSRVGP